MVPCSEPLDLPLPRGVRIASKTNASAAAIGETSCVVVPPLRVAVPDENSPVRYQTNVHARTQICLATITSTILPSPPCRSQAERSSATREALLDATIACLVEDGYANTTTSRVAERAGVSRGAHLHHFQTRQALVAAAMERLAERRGADLLAAAENLPEGRERLVQGLDLLWSSYANPLFQAALDLWTHARTDPTCASASCRSSGAWIAKPLTITKQLFPAIAEHRTSIG